MSLAAISLSSCLKDKPNTDFSHIGTVLELPYAGIQYYAQDAITSTSDTVVVSFGVNIASDYPLKTATNYTIKVDNTLLTAYNAANASPGYVAMPTNAYTISKTSGTIPAGARLDSIKVTIYKSLLDPTQSYMLPIALASTSNGILSGNFNAHYYHIIGNDFAGTYTWDYRRYNAGVLSPATTNGVPSIPSQGQGGPTSGGTAIGGSTVLVPISGTEFQMVTGYNGNGVMYDVTFTKTGTGASATYSNWSVTFPADQIAKWTSAGISNMVPPAFTVPPPAKATDPKFFELNYVSGGASARYIDDTYHK